MSGEGASEEQLRVLLAECQERFLAVLGASSEGLLISVGGEIVLANEAAAELTGYDREALIGMTPHEVAPSSAGLILAKITAGNEQPYEVTFRHAEGHAFPVELRGRNILWFGQPARATGLRDLRERNRAERSLRESERRFREMADLLPVTVGETDERGLLTFINRTGLEVLGYDHDEHILGREVVELLAPDEREQARRNLAARFAGEDLGPQQYLVLCRDGSTFPGMHYIGLIERDGMPVGVRTAVIDLTERIAAEEERRRLQAQMLQAQKLESLGILAGGIAHDFNNLLAAILGNAEVALLDLPEGSKARDPVAKIKRASLRASELVGELLAYAGKGTAEISTVSLNELVAGMMDLFDVSITKRAVIECDFDPAAPSVRVDATQLRQVVMNLVTNAAEALGPEGGRVRVITRGLGRPELAPDELRLGQPPEPRPYVCLEVQDSGQGMARETIPRVFEPFFTTKFAGRGLGLAAVLGIVRAHSGLVAVRSELGRGSVFRVLLPASEAPFEAVEPPEPAVVGGANAPATGRVLLVDDDAMLLEATTALLERLGCEVAAAPNGMQAIARFEQQPADLVILDWTMPGMPSGEVLSALRAIDPDVVVLIASGFDEADVMAELGDVEVAGFLHKPFRLATLSKVLRSLLGNGD